MVVNRALMWLLMLLCCVPSVGTVLRMRLLRGYYREHGRWRDAPATFVGTCVDGLLTGLGIGLSAAFGVLVLAALRVRLLP